MKLPVSWDLPKEIVERFGQTPGRQRALFADGHLLLVLHKAPSAGESERRGAFFWRKPNGEWKSTLGLLGRLSGGHPRRRGRA